MVAVNADSIARIKNFIYADLIPELLELDGTAARDGFALNVEAILAKNPQLVIQAMHNPDLTTAVCFRSPSCSGRSTCYWSTTSHEPLPRLKFRSASSRH
ncbi:hypothetical protein [Rhizobium sp. CG5]|uniref:hypothetical protein n=1 Tax=Rhizobium sp. CG5 TaxID=2726076 RepID=UPI00203345F0|nr:hypothetical protein [Rhizobium sp. CG5]